ncbi:WD repeat-containing protein 91 [Mizuhopecten yessoensis]|uniref:WD repeat-containing protein 91 n=1 Tax=Mizuhopecten yessoensis TaxID=6573 RepID=A0A210PVA7_MIZYE|nr:WD repeat-containing protein 91 [Mizuhopecten yessoensis]
MAAATGRVDEMVKDYLLYRGFTSAHRTFEAEVKNEKERGLRADRLVEQLYAYIVTYDLTSLREFWNNLNHRLFSRLEQRYMPSVRKLEVGLLKFYIVYASQNNHQDKVREFFEKMTPEIQNQSEFKDWFSFPFIKSPEENATFVMYFTKPWQDTYFLSLHNFLSVIIQAMHILFVHKRMKNLQEENDMMKQRLLSSTPKSDTESQMRNHPPNEPISRGANSMDLIYDFSALADESFEQEKQQKTTRRFPINFSAPPLLGKKSTNRSGGNNNSKKIDQTASKTAAKPSARAKVPSKPVNIQTKQLKPSQPQAGATPPQGQSRGGNGSADQVKHLVDHSDHAIQRSPAKVTAVGPEDIQGSPGLAVGLHQRQKVIDQHMNERGQLLGGPELKIEKRPSEGDISPVKRGLIGKSTPPVTRAQSAGTTDTPNVTSHHTARSVSVVESSKTTGHPKQVEMIQFSAESKSPTTGVESCPFLLLSQEEYCEHRAALSYCRFSNTGQYVASVDVDGVVKVWTWSPQPTTAATVMSKSAFLSLEWASKSDRWLLLGNRSGNIRLFDVKEMKSFYEATADASYPRVINLCASPAGGSFVCSASVNRTRSGSSSGESGPAPSISKVGKLTLWDLRTMKVNKQLPIDPGPMAVNCCSFNHNGQLLLTGAADGVIRMYDIQQCRCISQWEAHNGEVLSLQFSNDETTCYSMGSDSKFLQWSVHKPGLQQQELSIHPGASLPFLASGLSGGKEIPKGRLFAFDGEGQYILTCDKNKGLVYKVNGDLSRTMDLSEHKSNLTTVDWSPSIDTRVCLTGAMDGKVNICTLLSQ